MRIFKLIPLFLFVYLITAVSSHAQTETVTLIGTVQSALGCEVGQEDCAASQLTFDETHQLWIATFELPEGSYEYRAITPDGTIGALAEVDGAPIELRVETDGPVTFFYSPETNWLADDVNHFLANVPGSYQGEVGCPETLLGTDEFDWGPDCLQTLLQDPDDDGIYEYRTTKIPAGSYEAKVALNQSWSENYGDEGAPGGANIAFVVPKDNAEVLFVWDAESKIMTILAEGAPKGNLGEAKAYWLTPDLIGTKLEPEAGIEFALHYDPDAALELTETGIVGGTSIPLTVDEAGIPTDVVAKFPHLAELTALRLPADQVENVPDMLRGQFVFTAVSAEGEPIEATGLQIPGVLDTLYSYDGDLGVTFDGDVPTLRVWAPTAASVTLMLYPDTNPNIAGNAISMQRDDQTGVWSVVGEPDWKGQYYLYDVEVYVPRAAGIEHNLVTDPYSLSLAMNSTRSQIVDLSDETLMPVEWDSLAKPELVAPTDIVLYELHLRDFSIFDETVPEADRGTFAAFTHSDSNGMAHLRQLADAGLTHIHMLPLFDNATINENADERRDPSLDFLQRGEADSIMQQGAINALRGEDGFNWGYDPFHYTVPEGSYSTNPDGPQRIVEFRQMVQALNQTGLRVVMDVVYNHTNASGQSDKSVLDRVVPGYYHRLNSKGTVETSTCCANTATEHEMMRKLMVDSIVTWAKDYKVDGFRFDLMGHHMLEDMIAVREALDALTLENDGVDGKSIYVYGEGWNFGEVADNARGVNAVQLNLAGTGIGSFNDRLRDAARGGTPFGGHQEQGFATGLYTWPNETDQGEPEEQLEQLLLFSDQIRATLAGNLEDYQYEDRTGEMVTGADVPYGDDDAPTAYTAVPAENIVYVSAHDNETLFDAIQYKAPPEATIDERVRMQNLAHDLVMLAQGVPFFHAGSDLLRSKSMDRDSYDSGDWFNRLDFSYQTNNWGAGLPVADKNESNWRIMQPLLANPDLKPTREHILASTAHFQEMLKIRASSPLFRLQTAVSVQDKLQFHNTGPEQIPGLIVMSLDDTVGDVVDENVERVVVLFNGSNEVQTFAIAELADVAMQLHPILVNGADEVVKTAMFENGSFTVPALTTAVFVQLAEGVVAEDMAAAPVTEEPTESTTVEATDEAELETTVVPEVEVVAEDGPSSSGLLFALLGGLVAVILIVVFVFFRRRQGAN